MNEEINYKNNPLHSIGLKKMLIELTDHYGFEILFAYLNINCFKTNPSVASSVKFLKKTDWAREKVEAFYLYSFKNLPKASYEQYQLPPRARIIPDDQIAGEPAELSMGDAEQLREKRELQTAQHESGAAKASYRNKSNRGPISRDKNHAYRNSSKSSISSDRSIGTNLNPWGNPRTSKM